MSLKNITVIAVSILFSGFVHATEITNASITKVQTYTSGAIGLYTDKAISNPKSCNSSAKYIIEDNSGTNNVLSVLLAAKMAGKKVTLQVSDSICTFNYPTVIRADIE